MPPKDEAQQQQPQGKPDEGKLKQSVAAARKAYEAQSTAALLKERAKAAVNPKDRLRLWRESYDKEIEAHGQSKYAKRLQSGAWQGGAAGGGIGAAVALGLGGVVASLVSGLVAVPTTLVGGLVGVGYGAIKGPLVKLAGGGGGGNSKSGSDQPPPPMTKEQEHSAAMAEAKKLDDAVEKGAAHEPVPPTLEEMEAGNDAVDNVRREEHAVVTPERKKPRKLQPKSANEGTAAATEKRKPKKLEVRSGVKVSETAV